MASDLNKVFIIGRLVSDPITQQTTSGTTLVRFTIANNRTFVSAGEKKTEVSFFNIVAWAKLGDLVAQYCQKGRQVAIEGRLRQRKWIDKMSEQTRSVVEIVADNIQFLGMPRGNEAEDISADNSDIDVIGESGVPDDEDVPF
jgi:single-strand DNA-binding protein